MIDLSLPLLPLILDTVPLGLRQALAQQGVPSRDASARDADGRFVLFDSSRGSCRPLRPGQTAIDIDPIRQGHRRDPFDALVDEVAERQRWQIAGLSVAEEIARVDRRAVREKVLGQLRQQIERAGGLWISLAAYPFPHRSVLNFRIDYDRFDASDFDATLSAIDGHEQATSHFINAAAYVKHEDALARLRGLDVGSHGYHHHTYRTEEENVANIGRGIEVLGALGIEPSGFVAPGGRFNAGLAAAMERLRIGHSGEFGLAYDDLPFFPRGGKVLQIPVHPISLGIFLEAVDAEGPRQTAATQQAVRAAVDHFRQTARAKYRRGEPVLFYGHPTARLGRYPQVLRAVFDTADSFGAIWKTTLTNLADWWRARAEVRLSVVRHEGQFVVTVKQSPGTYRLGIEYHRGRHIARMPLPQRTLRFSPSALAYENIAPRADVHPVRVDGPEGLRGRLRRLIDWERETPIEEIRPTNWRNWAKRTIRILKR